MKSKSENLFILLFLLSSFLIGQSAFKLTAIDFSKLPKEIKYDGKIVKAVEWVDNAGKNIVVITETGIVESASGDDNRSASLYASHYSVVQNSYSQTWKVSDFVKECPVDIEANFIPNTFQVTDLDRDGTAEVWLMYKTACHGDVSPCTMKIIMYQGSQKYAVRGRNKVKISETQTEGGEYTFDKKFIDGPKSFRDFAATLWKKNILQ